MILRSTLHHEWQTTLSRPSAIATLLLLIALFVYGACNGRVELASRVDVIAHQENDVRQAQREWLRQIEALDTVGPGPGVPPWAGSPMDATLFSSMPPAPLADFAIGQSDLLPYAGAVSLWDPDIRLFSRYELDDPVALALGAFDLSKAVVIVLPLVLVVLCFDVLSADRDAGRQTLVLAQGVPIRRLLWWRLSTRAVFVLGVMLIVAAIALLVPKSELRERLPFFGMWMVFAISYAVLWVALIAVVASLNRNGATNITALLLAWAGITLLLPASVASLVETVHPLPSRPAWLSEAREVEIRTELAEPAAVAGFLLDHPDIAIDEASQVPAYARTAFLATRAVDEATLPILVKYEEATAARERSLHFMQYLSPAIAVHAALVDISGSSARRHRLFMAEARAMKAGYAERVTGPVVAGRRLSLGEARDLPELRLRQEAVSALIAHNGRIAVFLVLSTVLLVLLANWNLRRMEAPG